MKRQDTEGNGRPGTGNMPARAATLVASLFIMTLGVALSIRSNLGSSTISALPLAWAEAGGMAVGGFHVPRLTMGTYTFIMNAVFVALQAALLRRRFHAIQLFQLGMGFVFGLFLDLSMALTAPLERASLIPGVAQLLIGGLIMALGICLEVATSLLMMPSDGFTLALARQAGIDFSRAKIILDTAMVLLGAVSMLAFFHSWQWRMVGVGTLVSMVYVGAAVRLLRPLGTMVGRKVRGPGAG